MRCFSLPFVIEWPGRSVKKMERPNAWKSYKKTELKKVESLAVKYRDFLNRGKTERECVQYIVEALEKNGYIESFVSESDAGKKRTYYRITEAGIQYYNEKCEEWQLTKEVVERFVNPGS